jgi:hypothetical protein
MTVWRRANPDVLPGGRYDQGSDSLQGFRLPERAILRVDVPELTWLAEAPDARRLVSDIAETNEFGGFDGIGDCFSERVSPLPFLHAVTLTQGLRKSKVVRPER